MERLTRHQETLTLETEVSREKDGYSKKIITPARSKCYVWLISDLLLT